MAKHHADRHMPHGTGDHDDDDDGLSIPRHEHLGLNTPLNRFITLVDAIIAHPRGERLTAGHDGATDADSKLFWVYDKHAGLDVRAAPGLLTTATGNGGFALHVGTEGAWSLKFDGSGKVIGHEADEHETDEHEIGDDHHHPSPGVPDPAPGLIPVILPGTGAETHDGSNAPPELINGGLGWDTFQGGVGDYMIGGSGTLGGGLGGRGNCAVYTKSPGSILVDMENGFGYGGNAEGNVYVNMNQVRGSFHTNVLIGSSQGSDLKSGGDNSLVISTGGNGFEMRPDGRGNVLVSTVGGDRLAFDGSKDWSLGDDNIMLGFDLSHGCTIDLTLLTNGSKLKVSDGSVVISNFQAGISDINDYVRFDDMAGDGTHVLFNPTGQLQTSGGFDLIDLKFTHGLSVDSMYAQHQLMT